MVESAVADVVCPAVSAYAPDGFLGEVVDDGFELFGLFGAHVVELGLDFVDLLFDGLYLGLGGLRGFEYRLDGLFAELGLHLLEKLRGVFGVLVYREAEAEAEFRGVFKERVAPRGASAFVVDAPRGGREVASVDGGAAGGVRYYRPVAEELREELEVRGFAAAGAGARELKERTEELYVFDGRGVELVSVGLGDVEEEVPVRALGFAERHLGLHRERTRAALFLGLYRAVVGAEAAAGAVFGSDLYREGFAGEVFPFRVCVLEGLGGVLKELLVVDLGAYRRVRADEDALTALDAEVRIPDGDVYRDVALLVLRGRGREGTVLGQSGDGEAVAFEDHHGAEHVFDEFGRVVGDGRLDVEGAGRLGGDFDLVEVGEGFVDGLDVLVDYRLALTAVALYDGVLDGLDGFVLRKDAADGEEAGLHDCVRAGAHAGFLRDFDGVDDVELEVLVYYLLLVAVGQLVPDLFGAEGRVEEEGAAVGRVLEHVELLKEGVDVAGEEVGLVDEVAGVYRVGAEAQVADGVAAGLLGVVAVVALGVEVGLLAYYLDGVLVGADGSVRAEAVEEAAYRLRVLGVEGGIVGQAREGDVVLDADGEAVFRLELVELVVDALDHGGGEVLRGEAVASADDGDAAAVKRLAHVGAEGLADGRGVFAAVEDGYGPDGRGQRVAEALDVEGTEEADGDEADFLSVLVHVVDGFARYGSAGAHDDYYAFGVGRSVVVEEVVLAARDLREFVHRGLEDVGHVRVVAVGAFSGLEEYVGVLRGSADERSVGGESVVAVLADEVVVDAGAHCVVGYFFNFHFFVAGAEAVEEVEDGDVSLEGRHLGDEGVVGGLLDGRGAEHGPAGVADRHYVGVVSEDGERVGRKAARRDVHYGARELSGYLVHVRDHEEKSLRSGEGRAERSGLYRSVVGSGGSGLALHLFDERNGSPDVRTVLRGPLIRPFSHRRRRRDRVDRYYLVHGVGDMRRSFVPVYRYHLSL